MAIWDEQQNKQIREILRSEQDENEKVERIKALIDQAYEDGMDDGENMADAREG